jgi:hypothetical protein
LQKALEGVVFATISEEPAILQSFCELAISESVIGLSGEDSSVSAEVLSHFTLPAQQIL